MLSKILSRETCGKCRVCCGFVDGDKWEIPLVFAEIKENVEKKLGITLEKRGAEYVFPMTFDGDRVVYCPAASENGCVLGEDKPFDCAVWPFRVNELGGLRVITVSPVCESVSSLPLKTISEFVSGGFAESVFNAARLHPDMVKAYIEGYAIVAVETETL